LLFNSYEFIFVFLPLTFFIYFYLNKKRLTEASKAFLVLSSLFFYSWWNIAYLPLILISILFNFIIGKILSKNDTEKKKGLKKTFSRKSILIFGIVCNIALLAYYKYADFLIENFNFITNTNVNLLHLLLPLAISFFTFQQIAYLVDSYRNETKEYDFLNYSLFVTFFPQLIAGPIVHHKEMMPQFAEVKNKVRNYKNISLGIFIFSIGLFKKVVIADTFAVWATTGFDIAKNLNLLEAWATSLSYSFQLYFDFSGYTDMAIGLALLFNIKLPINFNSPYKSQSLVDVWKRWHITLSNFVNKYIFNTIVKSYKKYTFGKGLFTLFLSMVIIGLWHGASWMFVMFGAMHGVGLIINHLWKKKIKIPIPGFIGWILTFNFINISMIFFRAKEWDDAIKVLSSMFSLDHVVLPQVLQSKLAFLRSYNVEFGKWADTIQGSDWTILWLIFAFILILCFKNSMEMKDTFKLNYKTVLLAVVLFIGGILSLNKISEFLYFNF